jgi:hypothetical protein
MLLRELLVEAMRVHDPVRLRSWPSTNTRTRTSHAWLSRTETHTEFLSCFGPIRQHFALKRHLLRALLHRKQLAARFVAWREFTELAQNPSFAF